MRSVPSVVESSASSVGAAYSSPGRSAVRSRMGLSSSSRMSDAVTSLNPMLCRSETVTRCSRQTYGQSSSSGLVQSRSTSNSWQENASTLTMVFFSVLLMRPEITMTGWPSMPITGWPSGPCIGCSLACSISPPSLSSIASISGVAFWNGWLETTSFVCLYQCAAQLRSISISLMAV